MGRAIVREPRVFCMDEPLSNLDAKLRVQTRTQIAALQRRLGTTTVYVTHDQVEAMTMGDRVAVLRNGRLQQFSTPAELYDRPTNAFVAGFIGSPSMNLFRVPISSGGVDIANTTMKLPREKMTRLGEAGLDTVTIGIRPEQLELRRDGTGFAVTVELVEELGNESYIYARIPDAPITGLAGESFTFVARSATRAPAKISESLTLQVKDPASVHLFHPANGTRIAD